MRGIRQGLACFALAALLVSAPACRKSAAPGGGEPTTLPVISTMPAPAQTKDTLTLPFAQRDVLNPYAAETELNRELTPLLYEGLFAIDATFRAQPVLAEKITRQNATQWTVTLKKGRVFHNGKEVTAEDALYSFNKARATAYYAARLENIAKVQVQEGALAITLKKANEYIAACLDFPVVPAGSAEQGKLAQAKNGYVFTKSATPAGTGRYQLQDQDSVFTLKYDTRHPGPKPLITTIAFYGLNSTSALLYGLEMGNFQFAYDTLRDDDVKRVNATAQRTATTNLIFLVFNQSRAALRDPKLRAALAACIDKGKALNESFQGYAEAVNTPFPPRWHGIRAEDFAKPFDSAAARKALEALGYSEVRDGVRASRYRKLSFTLLVNSSSKAKAAAAKALQSQLKAFQIGIAIQALPQADYEAAAKAGRFDLCLGEIRLTPDCNLSPLLITEGAASKGINVWGKASNAYGLLLQGLGKPAEFVSAFLDEMPFLPLGYRCGMAVSVRSMQISAHLWENDLYAGIAEWK
ncbi:MAG: ABC transporter substrate-binding protein [Oscillospiraceae bacterium]|jgi:peptide/nickel transport system substrate-binding protein|nr:ABC transporter substrate-binding protein [Oscillospiraceae bacterium]